MTPAMETATRLALALDREDYEGAAALLAPGCTYRIGTEAFEGPAAIVASYRENGEWVKRAIDAVEYESEVREDPGGAVITYRDRLEHAGRRHTHTCEQRIRVDGAGRVCEIEHRDLPGERESLDAFFTGTGVKRETAGAETGRRRRP